MSPLSLVTTCRIKALEWVGWWWMVMEGERSFSSGQGHVSNPLQLKGLKFRIAAGKSPTDRFQEISVLFMP